MYLHPIPSVFIFLLIGRQPYSDDAFFALELARRSAALYGDSRHQEVAVAHSEWLYNFIAFAELYICIPFTFL